MKKYIKDLNHKEVIYAPTLEIARKLCKKFHELGLRQVNGLEYPAPNTEWGYKTVYNVYRPFDGTYWRVENIKDSACKVYTIDQLKDFDETFERGEIVQVRNYDDGIWADGIYLTTIDGSLYPYVIVDTYHRVDFENGLKFRHTSWQQIRKKPTARKVTRSEIGRLLGTDNFEIVD